MSGLSHCLCVSHADFSFISVALATAKEEMEAFKAKHGIPSTTAGMQTLRE